MSASDPSSPPPVSVGSVPHGAAVPSPGFRLRASTPGDVPGIVGLIGELADYEKLTHLLEVTPEQLHLHLFGPTPAAEAWVAESDDGRGLLAFALFFRNFSTFLGRPGLYLEDLYVQPQARGLGIGRALIERLAQLAVARGCGRFEWSVLDWNAPAIGFYQRLGATVMTEWHLCRVTGEALRRLGGVEGAA
jgi:GNAT superfamily N-acetyltransferase